MKPSYHPGPTHPHPINITPDIAAKCDAPNQFERFDRMFRTVIAAPKAEIDKRDTVKFGLKVEYQTGISTYR